MLKDEVILRQIYTTKKQKDTLHINSESCCSIESQSEAQTMIQGGKHCIMVSV